MPSVAIYLEALKGVNAYVLTWGPAKTDQPALTSGPFSLTLCPLGNFPPFLSSADFFQNQLF